MEKEVLSKQFKAIIMKSLVQAKFVLLINSLNYFSGLIDINQYSEKNAREDNANERKLLFSRKKFCDIIEPIRDEFTLLIKDYIRRKLLCKEAL
mmetsp:Transcript_18964/g.18108  ORF Transcript_18964/g.18108 Transcript_18964/m.18108 type:complete len:94 (+) Transcript_18964:96-377(+)